VKSIKTVLVLLALSAISFAQAATASASSPCAPVTSYIGATPPAVANPQPVAQAFDVAYVLSLPTAVQPLIGVFQFVSSPAGLVCTLLGNGWTQARQIATFDALVEQGYGSRLIGSVATMGWDPYSVVSMYSSMGANQINNSIQIGLGQCGQYALPGAPPLPLCNLGAYPTSPQPGWITIPPVASLFAKGANIPALLAQWYPPFAAPIAVTPAAVVDPVGTQEWPGSQLYYNAPGSAPNSYPNGTNYSDSRGTFIHISMATPFGNESWWQLVTPAN
jgi:hypothetical protein